MCLSHSGPRTRSAPSSPRTTAIIGPRRAALSESVASTAIDAEAKAAFEEALAAQEAGFYRSVVRLLFPEIERFARGAVYDGSRKEVRGKKKGRNNAGLADFREALMSDLPVGVVLDTPFALILVEKLYEHLYSYVPEDPAGLTVFERDPVPNRHASQHGYVTYSSAQNSVNMLAMADFMFHVIMRAKAYLEQLEEQAQAGPPRPPPDRWRAGQRGPPPAHQSGLRSPRGHQRAAPSRTSSPAMSRPSSITRATVRL